MRPIFDVVQRYLGDGTLTEYEFDFKITDLSQLLILVYDDEGEEVENLRGDVSDAFISSIEFDEEDGGGTVTLAAELTADYTMLLLLADDQPAQDSPFKNKFDLTLKRLEQTLDKISGGIQRVAYLAQRSVRLNDFDEVSDFDMRLPANLADNPGLTIAVNEDGDGFEFGPSHDQIESAQQAAIDAAASAAQSAAEAAASAASADDAASSTADASADAAAAAASAAAAAASAAAALASETAAAASAAAAATAETNAETAEANAETAQAAAEAARDAAQTAETNAETAETNAETAETNAAASAAAAATSEANAAASAAASIPEITGTRAAPEAIVAGTGIAFTGTKWINKWFIEGDGGAVDVSANPQIAAATNVGQMLKLQGRSDVNTVLLEDGNGLVLNGAWLAEADRVLELEWDGTNWVEVGRA